MNIDDEDHEDDILTPKPVVETVVDIKVPHDDDDDDDVIDTAVKASDEPNDPTDQFTYDQTKIDLRGVSEEHLRDVIVEASKSLSGAQTDSMARETGSWLNTLLRAVLRPNFEELRARQFLGSLAVEDRAAMKTRLREGGKTLLRTSPMSQSFTPGATKVLSGEAALLAFECAQTEGGGYRIVLYNSGITLDVLVPTGNDFHTLINNCQIIENELGSNSGTHYFLYNDLALKSQILAFLQPLIVGSSYANWKEEGALWSIMKMTDMPSVIAHLAAMVYRKGFEGFTNACTRPVDSDHPQGCDHVENITIDIFKTIITRYSVLERKAIDFLVEARSGITKHSVGQIAEYQSSLGLEGEKITIGNVSFVMRIPTVQEHVDAGYKFLADVINEIEGDNNARYEQMGHRFIRTLLPWIATVEKIVPVKGSDPTTLITDDRTTIIRELERIDDPDRDGKLRDAIIGYISKTQLTYVGYPVTTCPKCAYTADTPSGLWTYDPFQAFFTTALCYSMEILSPPENA